MWTSIKCLTEHDKNEVYQIVNIDVPIGYLNSGILYIMLMFAIIVYNDDHVMLLQFWGQSYILKIRKNRKILYPPILISSQNRKI